MKRIWRIAGIATLVAILGVATVGAVALAQDAENGSGEPFDLSTKFHEALADVLGISVDEYDAAVEKAEKQVVDEALSEGWLTEDQAEMLQWRLDQESEGGPGGGIRGFGGLGPGMGGGFDRGMGGGFDRGMGGGGSRLLSIAAGELDMSLTDLLNELQDGKSIADVAEDQGVDTQTIIDAYLAQVEENLKQQVEDGSITQKQADWQLEQAKTRVTDQLDNTWEDGFRGGRRPGGLSGPAESSPDQSES